MVAQHLGLNLAAGVPFRLDLGEDVDAVTAFLDHPRDSANLTLDQVQAVGPSWPFLDFQCDLLPGTLVQQAELKYRPSGYGNVVATLTTLVLAPGAEHG